MSRPRSPGDRYPCGDLKPKRPASVVEAEQQASYRQRDDEFAADVLAIRAAATPDEYARWIEAECSIDALPERVRVYLKRDQQLREYIRKCQRLQLSLLELRRQPISGKRPAEAHAAA